MTRKIPATPRARATASLAFALALTLAAVLVLFGAVGACGESTASPSGLGEPIRVRNGVFKEGALPGSPPSSSSSQPTTTSGLAITAIETASTVLRPGQGEKTLSGRASVGAVAIGIALGGLGRGYWLLGVDGPDPLNNGELGFQAAIEVARDVPPGTKSLLLVAIDAAGNAGAQRELPICVPRIQPDNLNACNPAVAPPAAIISLTWDVAADVDLIVIAPDGRVIDAKHPRVPTASVDAGVGVGDAGRADEGGVLQNQTPSSSSPFLARDSNAACVLDRVQQEDFVFPDIPTHGSWLVFVNLFDSCGKSPVHFRVAITSRQATADGKGFDLALTEATTGVLTSIDANGGARLGTYVTEVAF